eukprot:sb/3472024/
MSLCSWLLCRLSSRHEFDVTCCYFSHPHPIPLYYRGFKRRSDKLEETILDVTGGDEDDDEISSPDGPDTATPKLEDPGDFLAHSTSSSSSPVCVVTSPLRLVSKLSQTHPESNWDITPHHSSTRCITRSGILDTPPLLHSPPLPPILDTHTSPTSESRSRPLTPPTSESRQFR